MSLGAGGLNRSHEMEKFKFLECNLVFPIDNEWLGPLLTFVSRFQNVSCVLPVRQTASLYFEIFENIKTEKKSIFFY